MLRVKIQRIDEERIRVEVTIGHHLLLSRIIGPLYESEGPIVLEVPDE